MAAIKFEKALSRLETIVTELEAGELSLDDSLRIFEEGVKLSKTCLKMLDDAERKVEILVQDKDGRKRIQAFSLEDSQFNEVLRPLLIALLCSEWRSDLVLM